ncbi:MAG: PepSY-associated TM helix domain-containing protein [Saprospiraceae bacterium]
MSIFRQKQARILRIVRKIHRIFGIWLFLFLFVTGATGLLLGWKKNSFGLILAETTSGVSRDVQGFLLLDTIISISENHARLHFQNGEHEIDRIEVRPDKGIVKVNFKNNYKGLQIDATNGKILKVESRNSDLIEHIHDGSWFDRTFGLSSGIFKLIYTSLCGIGLIVFTVSGFWLWYGPKLIRRHHEE